MGTQLVFCIETNNKANTDWVYIRSTLDHYFKITNDIKLSPVHMDTKSKYNSRSVVKQIKDLTSAYKRNGKTVVIYCIDTDNYDTDPTHAKELSDIKEYCQGHGYEFVWFCRDVEDVYWGEQVHRKDKVQRAKMFKTQNRIDRISKQQLVAKEYGRHRSNILEVVGRYI